MSKLHFLCHKHHWILKKKACFTLRAGKKIAYYVVYSIHTKYKCLCWRAWREAQLINVAIFVHDDETLLAFGEKMNDATLIAVIFFGGNT